MSSDDGMGLCLAGLVLSGIYFYGQKMMVERRLLGKD